MRLRCTNCAAIFDGEPSARCPKCLRRTSVFETVEDVGPPEGSAAAAWPAGTSCPLCMSCPVSEATFHLEVAKVGSGAGGSHQEWRDVRCRCCDACRARVDATSRLRWTALPLSAIGTVGWVLALVSDAPLRVLGVEKLGVVVLATLLCAFVVGVPLVMLDRANSNVRRTLETSWLLRQVQTRLGHVDGALPPEQWRVVAEAPEGADVIEAAELLRS